ncbi:MAG: hypothetical protein RIQ41_22 [Candidatus Parcubacteria bacterium]
MSKIRTLFQRVVSPLQRFTLTTPYAILIGSGIVALSIVSYGYIIRPVTDEVRDFVKEVAKELKLKGNSWEQCLTSNETMEAINAEFTDGTQAGVTGTPTTFILVKKGSTYATVAKIEGAQTESFVRAALDQALSGKAETSPFTGSQIKDDELVKGKEGDVMVLEYADIQCPYCIRFHPTITSVMNDYQNRVGFAFRHFPLTQIHPQALPYAAAVECAGKEKGKDAYFGFIDRLFDKESGK